MSKSSPLLDDLLTLGGSLLGPLMEARHDLKSHASDRINDVVRKLNLVSREEFDVAFAMLAKARNMQEDLHERLQRIESHLNLSSGRATKKAAKQFLPSVKQGKKRTPRK